MSHHRNRILNAKPNREIINSRAQVPRFQKQDGKQRLLLKKQQEDNKKLMERIYGIMNESRQPGILFFVMYSVNCVKY